MIAYHCVEDGSEKWGKDHEDQGQVDSVDGSDAACSTLMAVWSPVWLGSRSAEQPRRRIGEKGVVVQPEASRVSLYLTLVSF